MKTSANAYPESAISSHFNSMAVSARSRAPAPRAWMRAAALALVLAGAAALPAHADEPFIGEVRLFAFDWCPKDWAQAHGQLLPVAQNTALFSILSARYGGNGAQTFALPDLAGRTPIGVRAPDLPPGSEGGGETTMLQGIHLPAHQHDVTVAATPATHATPSAGQSLAQAREAGLYRDGPGDAAGPATRTTGGAALALRDPYLAMTWCVALRGEFPPRN